MSKLFSINKKNGLLLSALAAASLIFVNFAPAKEPQISAASVCLAKTTYSKRQAWCDIAEKIDFAPDPNAFCGGIYRQPRLDFIAQRQIKKEDIAIEANHVSLSKKGVSTLSGHVTVKNEQRYLTADTAHIYQKNGKVTKIELIDNIKAYEPGHLVVANKGSYDEQNRSSLLEVLYYRLALDQKLKQRADNTKLDNTMIGWGQAQSLKRDASEVYYLKKASFTTCSPKNIFWQVQAKSVTLDKKAGWAKVKDAQFKIKGIPVAYLPYWRFSLNKERKTGFLTPKFTYRSLDGFNLAFPFYLNLAPNYDATLTPRYFAKRGVMADGEFRYLWPDFAGQLNMTYLRDDNEYQNFILTNGLNETNFDRYSLRWKQEVDFSKNWHWTIDYQKVSDDYYPQNFGSNILSVQNNQILGMSELAFEDENQAFSLLMQRYQTLHPINQNINQDIYSLYPQVNYTRAFFLSDYWQVNLTSQFSRFVWPGANDNTHPDGNRLYINPSLIWQNSANSLRITSTLNLNSRYYELSHYNTGHLNTGIVIPQFSIDAKYQLERNFHFWGQPYYQTLTPRLYYLYVPYKQQEQLPLFDTSPYIFSYDQLFRMNRFAGLDRIGDTNQVSFGLESQVFQEEEELLNLAIGSAFYLANRRVDDCFTYTGSCQTPTTDVAYLSSTSQLAPIATRAEYHLDSRWSIIGNAAYDTSMNHLNNASINLHYQTPQNRNFNLSYLNLYQGDNIALVNGVKEFANLDLIRVSYAWPINDHWRARGGASYNIDHGHPMGINAGLEYDSCCTAIRLSAGRSFNNLNQQGQAQFNNVVNLQIILKGVGSLSSSGATSVAPGF